jgi:hypothetical protein
LTVPITRIEKQSDGSRVVSGPVTDGLLDWDDQIVDPEWAAEKLSQWFNDLDKGGFNATIHQMHSPLLAPAGKGKDLDFSTGVPIVRAKVVEPTAIKLIDEDVYKAFSVGILDPPIYPDPVAKNGRIGRKGSGGFINEVSLVDVPANPRCLFSLAKRRGATKPVRETGVVEIVDVDGTVVPLRRARPEQIAKAFGGVQLSKKKKRKITKDEDEERDEQGRWTSGSMGGVPMESTPEGGQHVMSSAESVKPETGGGDKPLGTSHPGLDPLNRPWKERKKLAAKIRAAAAYYAMVKRDMDPDVGGGVDRDKLKPGDYVFPDTKNFPVVTPGDVTDAVSSWGRYKGSESFESFKSKLTALAHRKGPEFVKELPASWGETKKGRTMSDTATKAKKGKTAKDGGSKPEGKKCPTCKGEGTILQGNRQCPDCNGSGKAGSGDGDEKSRKAFGSMLDAAEAASRAGDVAGAAVAAAVTKSLTKDADDDVDAAIEDLAEATADARGAQAADQADDDDKDSDDLVDAALSDVAGAVSATAAAQGMDQIADVLGGKAKKSKKGKKGKEAMTQIPTGDDDACPKCGKTHSGKCKAAKKKKGRKNMGNGAGGGQAGANVDPDVGESSALPGDALVMQGGVSKSKKGKGKKGRKGIPSLEKRLHDMLCPSYSSKAVKSVYGEIGKELPLVDVLDPEYFAARMAEVSAKGGGDVAEAYQALAASTKLSVLSPKTFLELRAAAAKGYMDAYPDVHLRPQMIDPEDFKRSFLSSSNPETSSVTRVPMPDLKTMFGPEDFDRGPLTTNETRPTLSSGTSVAKGKKNKGNTAGAGNPNSRTFYTNAAKDDNQNAMAMLHDHIVSRYPGVCPMEAQQPGTDIDRDGLAGSAAELQAKGPGVESLPTPTGAGDAGTLRPIGKKQGADKKKTETPPAKVGKAAGTAATDTEAIEGLVKERLRKERKVARRKQRRLVKSLKRRERRLTKRADALDKALAQPNPRSRAHRGTSPAQFTPKAVSDPEKILAGKQAADRIRTLKSRTKDGNSTVAQSAVEELMRTLSPEDFAKVMAADVE